MANLRKINVGGAVHTLGLTDEQLAKLNGISEKAQVNVIEAIKLNGKNLEVNAPDKSVNIVLDTEVFKIVSSLPAKPAAGDENKIHVVQTSGGGTTGNSYTEHWWDAAKNAWEKMGEFKADVDLSNYVQKEPGKGLSSNDYTTAEKEKLAGLQNYNDQALQQKVTDNATQIGNNTKAIDFNKARIEQVATGANKVTFDVAGDTLNVTVTDVPITGQGEGSL